MSESSVNGQVLTAFQTLGGTMPIALDGTWDFSSENIHCEQCSTIEHKSGPFTHYQSAITPVIVAPAQKHAIALRPEFIVPQDRHDKQDCETAAAIMRMVEKGKTVAEGGHSPRRTARRPSPPPPTVRSVLDNRKPLLAIVAVTNSLYVTYPRTASPQSGAFGHTPRSRLR